MSDLDGRGIAAPHRVLGGSVPAPEWTTGGDAPEWMSAAVCASSDPELWYPEKGQSTREAKAICVGCPSVADCLAFALDNHERFGIWGALSERERRRFVKATAVVA